MLALKTAPDREIFLNHINQIKGEKFCYWGLTEECDADQTRSIMLDFQDELKKLNIQSQIRSLNYLHEKNQKLIISAKKYHLERILEQYFEPNHLDGNKIYLGWSSKNRDDKKFCISVAINNFNAKIDAFKKGIQQSMHHNREVKLESDIQQAFNCLAVVVSAQRDWKTEYTTSAKSLAKILASDDMKEFTRLILGINPPDVKNILLNMSEIAKNKPLTIEEIIKKIKDPKKASLDEKLGIPSTFLASQDSSASIPQYKM